MTWRSTQKLLLAVSMISASAVRAEVPIDLAVQFGTESESPEAALATLIDTICAAVQAAASTNEAPNELSAVCSNPSFGDALDSADVFTALSARSMSGETTAASRGSTVNVRGGIQKRLASLLRMSKLRTSSGGPVEYYVDGRWIPAAWMTAAGEGTASDAGAQPDGLLSQRWGAFFDLGLTQAEQDESVTQAGFKSDANGLTGGADYRIRNNAFIGGALRYQSTDGDLKYDAGSMSGSEATLTFYGTYYPTPNLYFETALLYSSGSYDLTRNITFDLGGVPTTATAKSSTNTTRTGISFDGGYNFDFRNGGTLNTSASLLYSKTEIDPFSETGAGGFNLKVDGQSTTGTTLNLTAQYTHAISTPVAIIIPEAGVSIIKEFVTDRQKVSAYFAVDPSQTWFRYKIQKRDDFYGNVDLGSTFVFAKGRSGFLRYERLIGYDNYTMSTITLGGRMEF